MNKIIIEFDNRANVDLVLRVIDFLINEPAISLKFDKGEQE